MTRAEFIRQFAGEAGEATANLGFVRDGDRVSVALPCSCGEPGCHGWAMVSAESIDSHLRFKAPMHLREAYYSAVNGAGGK